MRILFNRGRMRWCIAAACIMHVSVISAAQKTITITADKPGISISPTLYGIFFEDINWAADGGIYAEMIQNRSFEYIDAFGSQFTPLTAWSLILRGGATASMAVATAQPVNEANPRYVEIKIEKAGSGAGIANAGFGGIAVTSGETYNASLWMKRAGDQAMPVALSIEKHDGTALGSAVIDSITSSWACYKTAIKVNASETAARFVVTAGGVGTVAMDMISLFPQKTFKNRQNGLRSDLVQRLIDLKPQFMRFPGGCIVHSNNLATAYRWKTTIGPVERRRWNANRWGYMQSGGLGFFEYFQLCEDIGAAPLPVVPCGVSCHFKSPYQTVPMGELQPWIDDALNLIEYANGPATSTWGAERAAAGHPQPFNLEYIGIGNEEWGPEFKERSTLFVKAIREKYPSVKIVGTAGPSESGADFTDLWAYNRTQKTDIVDEHYYQPTSWFLANTRRYDGYARNGPLVFAGEYASRDPVQKTLSNAVAEAAFMTGLERNGDLVRLSSYAPLFCHVNCNGSPAEGPWNPDLIYFDHYRSYVTPSYQVQALFANNAGHRIVPTAISGSASGSGPLYAVTSLDTLSGDIIIKVVNSGSAAETCTLRVEGQPALQPTGSATVLTSGKSDDANSFTQPELVKPVKQALTNVSPRFVRAFPANSVSVVRLATQSTSIRGNRKEAPAAFSDAAITFEGASGSAFAVKLALRQGSHCTIRWISPAGDLLATLLDTYVPAGGRTIRCSGLLRGRPLPSGVHILDVSLGGKRHSIHRMAMIP